MLIRNEFFRSQILSSCRCMIQNINRMSGAGKQGNLDIKQVQKEQIKQQKNFRGNNGISVSRLFLL